MSVPSESSYTLGPVIDNIPHEFRLKSVSGSTILTATFDKDGWSVRCAPYVSLNILGGTVERDYDHGL